MHSILHADTLALTRPLATAPALGAHQLPHLLTVGPLPRRSPASSAVIDRVSGRYSSFAVAAGRTLMFNSVSPRDGVYTVGEFMTKKEDLHVVKPTTTVDEGRRAENDMFLEVDSSRKTFNQVQELLSKTNGKVVGDLMTPAPFIVRETTNLEDVPRLLLETKYCRLPVVDADGKLVGIITRGNVVRAALQIKRANEGKA